MFTSETIPETSGKELFLTNEHNEKHGALSLLLWETVCTHNTPHQALRVIDFPFRELEHSCAGVYIYDSVIQWLERLEKQNQT